MVRGKLISSFRTCNMAALPRAWFLCFLLSSIIEVVVYFNEFHQKPTTLDGDGIVINTAHLMSEQWHVSAISVKYREYTPKNGACCMDQPAGMLFSFSNCEYWCICFKLALSICRGRVAARVFKVTFSQFRPF